ncbi:hypothetical protein [Polaribacter atrinae]|uniref:Uncharacterized protein n=1 Tax=Polaribacter atrinae TaxID=1333662 RepID=A0A176TDM2_9FLAO|nr:hypothetical protein [Polaribacter atrinae]OAD46017.1 hypothetical protein LPB303_03620 [Polaribacter atrinae]
MIKTKNLILICSLIALFVFIKCTTKSPQKEVIPPIKEVEKAIDYEAIYNSLVIEYKPEITSQKEFKNFKNKSNYEDVIEAYDVRNSPEILGGKSNKENIRYYELPTTINTQEHGNNGIIFGDLNNDNKRDCIISVFRSDGYNEVTFFYVFINHGDTFKLEDVANENDICGCKKESWPNLFRYQKIEDGYLKGVSQCHHKDAHCCPSLFFRTKVSFTDGKLQFDSAEFVMDDAVKYRATPKLESILYKLD